MSRIDESRPFVPLHIAVVTVSDTRDEATDKSGAYLVQAITEAGHKVAQKTIIKDERATLESALTDMISRSDVDVVVTTGGTGVTPRDVTPEAVEAVSEKIIPGFGELFRWLSYEGIGTSTIQSRAIAGSSKATFIFALPGSTGACRDGWDKILKWQLDIRHRPCNFAELLPRMRTEEPG